MSTTSGANPVSAEPLQRLHALLVEAVRQRRGADPHAAPVTVAEIYQELVPYRQVRAAIGLEMNADYEHTLLRLLSGERQLARIEPAAARDQMERELESPNPNVGLYRKFAGCDVWLLDSGSPTPSWVVEHLAEADTPAADPPPAGIAADPPPAGAAADPPPAGVAADPAPGPGPAAPVAAAAPIAAAAEPHASAAEAVLAKAQSAGAARTRQPEQPRNMTTEPENSGAREASSSGGRVPLADAAGHCAFCDSALPTARQVRFCPFCGADQSQRPCSTCGEPLQQGWAFCIACGGVVAVADA